MIKSAYTFKYGQVVFHYTDVQCEQPMIVVESDEEWTEVTVNGEPGRQMTDNLWRG